jgi:hypothetical protein
MNRRPLLLAVLFLSAAGSTVAAQDSAPVRPRVIAEFGISKHGEFLSLPLELNGKKYRFLLDTGATHTVFDLSFKDELGQPLDEVNVGTVDQDIQVPVFACPDASIGALPLRAACGHVLGFELTGVRKALGKDIRGIIGMDFLQHWVLQIHPERGKISFLSSVDETTAGTPERLTRVDDAYFLSAEIPGWGLEKFLVDTGSLGMTSCNMETNLFQWLCQCKTVFPFGTVMSEVWSGVTARQGRLAQLTVGPFRHHDLLCAECRLNMIGLEYLFRYVVTFDFPNETAYLRPCRSFARREPGSSSGLSLVEEDGQTVVHAIDPGSPAEVAGFEPDDVIVAAPQSSLDPAEVHELYDYFWSRKGEEIELWVLRGDELLQLRVKLRDDWTWPKRALETPPSSGSDR